MRTGLVVVTVLAAGGVVRADLPRPPAFCDRWPAVPTEAHYLSFEMRATGHLTDYGNRVGGELANASHQLVGLEVDAAGHSMHVRVGGGAVHYLRVGLEGQVHIVDGMAQVKARLALGIAGHQVAVQLPEIDMVPSSVAASALTLERVHAVFGSPGAEISGDDRGVRADFGRCPLGDAGAVVEHGNAARKCPSRPASDARSAGSSGRIRRGARGSGRAWRGFRTGFMPAAGSSSRRRTGSTAMARAISRRRWSP